MERYHYVWLGAHPERSSDWLEAKIAEGFHVHHIDGDHDNNGPHNLVLIDGVDHMRLHGTMNLTQLPPEPDKIVEFRDRKRKRDYQREYMRSYRARNKLLNG